MLKYVLLLSCRVILNVISVSLDDKTVTMENTIKSFKEWSHLVNTGTQRPKVIYLRKCTNLKFTGQNFLHTTFNIL